MAWISNLQKADQTAVSFVNWYMKSPSVSFHPWDLRCWPADSRCVAWVSIASPHPSCDVCGKVSAWINIEKVKAKGKERRSSLIHKKIKREKSISLFALLFWSRIVAASHSFEYWLVFSRREAEGLVYDQTRIFVNSSKPKVESWQEWTWGNAKID